ncbi:hypothetical protein MNBD_GAMMA14-1745, partial [hydrothermal vent metagenome]
EPEAELVVEEPEAAVTEDEAVEEKPAKKKMGLGMAIGIFAGINVLLGVIGFGVWWFLKRRKKKGADDESEEDDEADEEEGGK